MQNTDTRSDAQPITASTQAAVIRYARRGGNDANDLRDALHEVTHALDFDVPHGEWGRESIHSLIIISSPPERMRTELLARAVEWLGCESAGIEYDPHEWALWALMESPRSGVQMPSNLVELIAMMKGQPQASRMLARIVACSAEAGPS